ncbi:MAG: hypothetical protein ABL963_02560 [Longimicrobiales bacterium]
MAIDPTRTSEVRTGSAEKAAEVPAPEKGARAPAPPRGDQVEISAEARSLAERGGVDRVPFTDARVVEIKERLQSGFYDRPEVVRAIAERIVDSGEV